MGYLLPKDEIEIRCLKVARQETDDSKIYEGQSPANFSLWCPSAMLQPIFVISFQSVSTAFRYEVTIIEYW